MIRSMLLATAVALPIAMPAFADHHMSDKTIVETAVDAGDFTTLVAAIEAAGLAETLSGDGPFTVFAPTDAAFEALPDGTLETLLMPENKDKLTDILTYHVVSGEVMSSDLSDGMEAETLQGMPISVTMDDDAVMINDASVTQADVEASNGVIHVIDTVLLPEG